MEDISPRVLQIKVMKNMADARMLQHQMEKMRAEMLVNTDGMTALEFLYINPAESPVGLRAQEVFGRFEVAVINGVQATMALARNAGDDIAPAIKSILNRPNIDGQTGHGIVATHLHIVMRDYHGIRRQRHMSTIPSRRLVPPAGRC